MRREEILQLPEQSKKLARLSWRDAAVVLFSGTCFLLFHRVHIPNPDEGLILAAAERILLNQIPFRDFFSELGPGSFYIHALLLRVTGNSVASLGWTVWALGVVMVWLLYRLTIQIVDGAAAFAPPLVLTTICYPYVYFVSHHWWGSLFFLLMLLFLTKHYVRTTRQNRIWATSSLFTSGIFAALAFLCMQPVGVLGIGAVLCWFFLAGRAGGRSWRNSVHLGLVRAFWFLLGTVAILGLTAVYFWRHGALGAWVYDNFTFLFTNYRGYENSPGPYSWERLVRLFKWVIREPSIQNGYFIAGYYFFAVAAPAIGFSGAIWQIRGNWAKGDSRAPLLMLYLLAGWAALLSEMHNSSLLNLIYASPVILILFVNAWNDACCFWPRSRRLLLVAAGLVFAVVVTAAFRRAIHSTEFSTPVQTRRGTFYCSPDEATHVGLWINAIQHAVPTGGEAFFFPYAPQFYFLTATHNPTEFDTVVSGFHTRQQIGEAISTLQAGPPGLYVFSFDKVRVRTPRDHLPDDPLDYESPGIVERSLLAPDSHFNKAGEVAGMEIWVHER